MKREKLTHARSLLTACVCTAASKRTTVVKPAIFFSAGSFMGFNASAKSFVRKLVQSIIFLSSNKRALTMWQLRIFTNMQKTESKGSPFKILHLIPHTSRWPLFPRLKPFRAASSYPFKRRSDGFRASDVAPAAAAARRLDSSPFALAFSREFLRAGLRGKARLQGPINNEAL